VIVIVGPTASGKTDLAAALAERLGGEVLCADSRQVYRALDAATAKPPAELRARVPHHLVDVADPAEAYDAGRFAREAAAALALIRGRGKVPIVCGGTGLYVRALIEGLTSLPPRDPAVRARLAALAEREGWNSLHARLALADPSAAASIPAANTQRVMRALEVLELTGRPISEHWAEGRSGGGKPSAVLRLDLPPHALRENIDRRTRAMWPALLAEVRALVPARFRGDEPRLPLGADRDGRDHESGAGARGDASRDQRLCQETTHMVPDPDRRHSRGRLGWTRVDFTTRLARAGGHP